MDILSQVKDQKDPLNITSVGENIFYHGIHFLRGRGWTEESLLEAVRNHYNMYTAEPEESDENPEVDASENQELLENLMKELKNRDLDSSSFTGGDPMHIDEEGGPLEAKEPDTFTYPEWDFRDVEYKPNWCLLHEKKLPDGEANFYKDTLTNNSSLVYQIKKTI